MWAYLLILELSIADILIISWNWIKVDANWSEVELELLRLFGGFNESQDSLLVIDFLFGGFGKSK